MAEWLGQCDMEVMGLNPVGLNLGYIVLLSKLYEPKHM